MQQVLFVNLVNATISSTTEEPNELPNEADSRTNLTKFAEHPSYLPFLFTYVLRSIFQVEQQSPFLLRKEAPCG